MKNIVIKKLLQLSCNTCLMTYANGNGQKEVIVYVHPHNTAALNLYKKLGFSFLEGHGDDEVVLKKEL